MKILEKVISFIVILVVCLNNVNADEGTIFHNLIRENHNLQAYPFLEERNDIGIFYEFKFDEEKKIIKIKRNKDNYPILRFSLFEKDKIKPGDVVIKYNEIDLSKLEDDKLVKLHKQNQNVNLKILNANDLISLNSNSYFLNEIKLVRFDLDYINRIDTTKGVLEISFDAFFLNERPEFNKYAKGVLRDVPYYIDQELLDYQLFLPIEEVTFSEYLKNVDIRTEAPAEFSYDNGSVRTTMRDYGIGEFRQKFDFKKFPFDKQKLIIKINSGAQSTSNPEVNYPRGVSSVTFITPDLGAFVGLIKYQNTNLLKELGWTLISTDIVSEEVIDQNYFDPYLNTTYDYHENTINLVLNIERNYAHYVFKIIIPVFLILCVAWSVLWIPTYKLDARLTTSIVALLALIAYNFVFEGDIPKLDYLTDLDKFILLSYVFCCIPTFSSIGFSRLIKKTDKLQIKATKINSVIRKWGAVIYLLIFLQIFKPFI